MNNKIILITGTRKGIGCYLANYYLNNNCIVIGCSRGDSDIKNKNYKHFTLDVSNEKDVKKMFSYIRKNYKRLDVLINNAGIASMNHLLLTPLKTIQKILTTNVVGSFLFCREASKIMKKNSFGRIINFSTVATPLKLEGESVYAASKAAIVNLTQILAFELADFGITVNSVGPTPVKTDLIRSVPEEKIEALLSRQAITRFGKFEDISNAIDFFIKHESDFITGQNIYLGGIN